jgi:hypothetical protein
VQKCVGEASLEFPKSIRIFNHENDWFLRRATKLFLAANGGASHVVKPPEFASLP